MPQIFIRLIPLPFKVHGLVTPNEDGTYNVYLNERLPAELQRRYLSHELSHIAKDHLYDDVRTVDDLENEADTSRAIPRLSISA